MGIIASAPSLGSGLSDLPVLGGMGLDNKLDIGQTLDEVNEFRHSKIGKAAFGVAKAIPVSRPYAMAAEAALDAREGNFKGMASDLTSNLSGPKSPSLKMS